MEGDEEKIAWEEEEDSGEGVEETLEDDPVDKGGEVPFHALKGTRE